MRCTHCHQRQTPEIEKAPCPVRRGVGHAWLAAQWVDPHHPDLDEYAWP